LAKARIEARYIYDKDHSLEHFENAVKQRSVVPQADQYGLALALLRHEKPQQALNIIEKLIAESHDNLFYIDTLTDVLIALEKPQEAVKELQQRLVNLPRNPVIVLNLANAAIEAEQFDYATELLRDFMLLNPDHLLSHQLLSDAYAKSDPAVKGRTSAIRTIALVEQSPAAKFR
jgi:predicted Zn-dependent protease